MRCLPCQYENCGGARVRAICRHSFGSKPPACGKPPLRRTAFCHHGTLPNWHDDGCRIPPAGTSTVDDPGRPPTHHPLSTG